MSFTLHRGTTPVLVSMPHVGTVIPQSLRHRFVERAGQTEDTDWFLDRLYAFVKDLGASLIVPLESRYVIDLNRPSDNRPMYAGQNNTELCPTRFFTGDPLYRDGMAPSDGEVQERVRTYWQPYHDALRDETQRLKSLHGHAVLFDAHSIKGTLPWLFEGDLPDMNLGTSSGHSCATTLREQLTQVFASQTNYSYMVDGRFKGGHITRHFGQPDQGVHTVQLEMSWRAYMEETPPYAWHPQRAAAVTPLLQRLVQTMIDWRPN